MRSDEELFVAYRDGDIEAFNEIVERYKGRLFFVILCWTRDKGLAEEIFQETFLRVIKHRENFDSGKKFSTWIFQIARNLTTDQYRRFSSRREEPIDGYEFSVSDDPSIVFSKKEELKKLGLALSSLTEEQREVVMLRHQAGLSFKEIAELTGANLNTVLSRMRQAILKLKELLNEDER